MKKGDDMDGVRDRAGIKQQKEKQEKNKKKKSGKKPDKRDRIKNISPEYIQNIVNSFTSYGDGEVLTDDYDADEYWKETKSDIMAKYHQPKEVKKELQDEIDVTYILRLENATHFHRGTKIGELDSMLDGETIGHNSPNPNYTYLTTKTTTAYEFAFKRLDHSIDDYFDGKDVEDEELIPVKISIPKGEIIDEVVSAGYSVDYDDLGENENDIDKPQGYDYIDEEEHRLKPDTVSTHNLGMEITIYTHDPKRRKHFAEKYKSFGKIRFV